jgi:peptidoglycan/xylan/chitin deacetylase (PgdA/CDA1 family)
MTFDGAELVPVDFARTLERELAETERLRFGADADRRRLRAFSDQLSDNLSAVGAAYNAEKARAEKAEAALAAEREKVLVGSVALIEVKMERAKLRTENAELWRDRSADGKTWKTIGELRAEVERLKADGAASAFINMSCRASRAETDRNNLRADLDAVKSILTEEKHRAERAEAELATERARLDSGTILLTFAGERVWHSRVDLRAAIDAAMKEGAK